MMTLRHYNIERQCQCQVRTTTIDVKDRKDRFCGCTEIWPSIVSIVLLNYCVSSIQQWILRCHYGETLPKPKYLADLEVAEVNGVKM